MPVRYPSVAPAGETGGLVIHAEALSTLSIPYALNGVAPALRLLNSAL